MIYFPNISFDSEGRRFMRKHCIMHRHPSGYSSDDAQKLFFTLKIHHFIGVLLFNHWTSQFVRFGHSVVPVFRLCRPYFIFLIPILSTYILAE